MAVELFATDFCPFAQRAWLAFLEKESDPSNPKLFSFNDVNYFNPSLENTKRFLAVHNTVPAIVTPSGQIVRESMPVATWVDEQHPKINPLQPASAEGVAEMKRLITKFTSGKFDIVGCMYQLLWEVDSVDRQKELTAKLLASYAELSKDLQASSGGPYLLGAQFTLADIALIPFVDRALVLLPHFKGVDLPDTAAFQALRDWRTAYMSRASWRISSADRLPRSVAVQPFAATNREEYIREAYAAYANGVKDIVRKQLRHAPPGVATQDIAKAVAEKKAAEDSARSSLLQNRVGYAVGILAVLTLSIVKVWQWNKNK